MTGRQPETAGELGEFGLIARIVAAVAGPASSQAPAGPGDDAAVVPAPDGRVVATTDLLAEGVHFRFDWSTGYEVGRKAAAANLSDVAAMGAVPTALLVGIALPADTPLTLVDALAEGLRDEAALVGAAVVGGDTIASSDRLTLAVTALGDLQGRAPVTRRATSGGVLWLTGRPGRSAAGLALLQAGLEAADLTPLLEAHRRPAPPYALGPLFAIAGALAMCDVSDGLIADLGHLADASGATAELDISAVLNDPLAARAGAMLSVDPADWILTGGEDHGLLVVLPAGVSAPGGHRIGTLRPGGPGGVRIDGNPAGTRGGFDHFAR